MLGLYFKNTNSLELIETRGFFFTNSRDHLNLQRDLKSTSITYKYQ